MMKRLSLKFLCILLILAVHQSAWAGIEFQEVLSYTVPGVDGIQKFALGDVDRDGIPEVLASDSNNVILYSSVLDSVLFQAEIDWSWNSGNYKLILDDINRDSYADVVIGVYYIAYIPFDTCRIIIADGCSLINGICNSHLIDYYVHSFIYGYPYSAGLTILDAIDTDDDGYKELLISCDSSNEEFWCGMIEANIAGLTHLYYSFPDSLAWSNNCFISEQNFVDMEDAGYFIATRHTGNYTELGPDRSTYRRLMGIVDDTGLFVANSTIDYRHSLFTPGCLGNIDTILNGLEIISYDYSQEYKLRIHHFSGPYSLTTVSEFRYESPVRLCIYLPQYPGHFLGYKDHNFILFNGENGEDVLSTNIVPYGVKSWVYPFNDNEPYLAVVVNNDITLYKPAIITAADEGEEIPIPAKLSLANPYPNPFNSSQTITIKASPGDILTVDVYNLLGQKIESIHNARVTGLDEIKIVWEPGEIPTGIYFIKAFTQDQATVVKSILLK